MVQPSGIAEKRAQACKTTETLLCAIRHDTICHMAGRGMVAELLESKHTGESTEIEAYRKAIRTGRAGPYSFVLLVGLRSQDPFDILRRLKRGLAFTALERFQRNSGLSTVDLAEAVVIKLRTLHRRKEQGRLEPEESDRLLRVARVFGRALELFEGNAEAARQWLATRQSALGGERPMVLAKTDVGAREVEALADRLEHGVIT